uniref:Docking protein 1b n=1 Tax=Neolamprologus brichardi TaxID=32507 RepID=A0A3Q4GD13_NEOBR
MAAFCVETNDKTHVFSAEKAVAKDWMDTMCDIAFQVFLYTSGAVDSNGGPQDLQMAENLIYYSREEGKSQIHWKKEVLGLLLLLFHFEICSIPSVTDTLNSKLTFFFFFFQVMFSFEAGRRCDSGPGTFTFETKQGNEIFILVDQAIQSQKALAEERRLSSPLNSESDCPASLQHLHGGRVQGGGTGLKGRSLPEPPGMLGVLGGAGTPPRSPKGHVGKGVCLADESTGLYSEPADSVRLPLQSADCLYSDPVDSIKGQNQTSSPSTITMDLNALKGAPSPPASSQEHIYDEPEGCAKGSIPASLGMLFYDKAHAEPHSQRRQEETVTPSGQEGKQPQRQSPPQFGQGRGTPQPPTPRFPKPLTAPKPGRGGFARKEPVPLPPGKHGGPANNVNNNNNIWGGVNFPTSLTLLLLSDRTREEKQSTRAAVRHNTHTHTLRHCFHAVNIFFYSVQHFLFGISKTSCLHIYSVCFQRRLCPNSGHKANCTNFYAEFGFNAFFISCDSTCSSFKKSYSFAHFSCSV